MDDNDIGNINVKRRIYTKEELTLIRSSELSNLWPKSLDKDCINSNGQYDPVKSFDSSKPNDSKRNSFYENKPYRNNEKNKDDISLRPERRRWNDGCQAPINKRNSEDNHTNSYRKSFQGGSPSNGGGDYDKRSFNRNSNRSLKMRDNDRDNKYNNGKPEKFSKNNSNSEERRDEEKDEHIYNSKNFNNNTRNQEPEWFSNGPENCEETIELRGITANDKSIVDFKKDSSKNDSKDVPRSSAVIENEKLVINFNNESQIFLETCITSPKREGSRFQDIFQKETKNNYLKETKDVENIIKAVLSENVSKIDAERLHNATKPLPNGVLTLEEIEKGMISDPVETKRVHSKSTTIDTLTSFDPSQTSFLSSGVSSPSVDNSKVVNWLSNLNVNIKEHDIDEKPLYLESQNYQAMNNVMPQPPSMYPANVAYQNFAQNLQHPPGLPRMVSPGHLLQQALLQHQQTMQTSQQNHQSMSQQNNVAYIKQLSMNSLNSSSIPSRNSTMGITAQEMFMAEKYKLQQQHSVPNDTGLGPNVLSSMLHAQSRSDMTSYVSDEQRASHNPVHHNLNVQASMMMPMNGPPGLMSRAIVKTHQHFTDAAQVTNGHLFHDSHRDGGVAHINSQLEMLRASMAAPRQPSQQRPPPPATNHNMLHNLFNVNPSYLPPLPQQAKYADQIETENV